jgi:uncharacterized Fe-S cluster-containing radical SAM superfamily protein
MARIEKITTRLYNVSNMTKDYLREDPPYPKSVKIELCSVCNFKCSYCAITTREIQPQAEMDFDLFKKIANNLKECGVSEVGLFYVGEPFMCPNILFDAISYLKDELQIPYVFLTSNGSLATGHEVKRCMKRGLDSLKWSVNFADVEQFKTMTSVKNSEQVFDRVLYNIKTAYETRNQNNYPTRLYASSIHYNDEQVEKMQPILNLHVLPYVDEHYWLPLLNEVPQFGNKKTPGNSGIYDKAVEPIPCWVIFTAGHVLTDGRFTVCCHDAIGKWVMGDLKTQTLKEIWNSEKFRELRRAHLAKEIRGTICESCIEPQYNIGH